MPSSDAKMRLKKKKKETNTIERKVHAFCYDKLTSAMNAQGPSGFSNAGVRVPSAAEAHSTREVGLRRSVCISYVFFFFFIFFLSDNPYKYISKVRTCPTSTYSFFFFFFFITSHRPDREL